MPTAQRVVIWGKSPRAPSEASLAHRRPIASRPTCTQIAAAGRGGFAGVGRREDGCHPLRHDSFRTLFSRGTDKHGLFLRDGRTALEGWRAGYVPDRAVHGFRG